MRPALSKIVPAAAAVGILLAPACGGGGDGTPPVTVATVVITAPAAPPTFGTVGRTVQFSAQARDAGGAPVNSAITWNSSSTSVADVSASGLVTANANGTTQITASAGGVQSTAVVVTVAQVAAAVLPSPASVTFGAIGKTRQLAATVMDSLSHPVAGASVTWTAAGPGTVASVSGTGLATALAAGTGDSAVATSGAMSVKIPISVVQVVTSVGVTSTSVTPDTLRTTTRTRQFTATARDSNNNVVNSATFAWTSSLTAVATVSNTGLVTAAAADGSTNIQASAGAVNGTRPMVVQHFPSTFTLAPTSASIATSGGTTGFTGTALDSVNTTLTINWSSKATTVATVSPTSGAATTATATGNGSTFIVMASGALRDSATLTVSNQPVAPSNISVTVGDDFFKSVRNNTQNPAVDTVAVGGQVTWTWTGAAPHTVRSTGSPSFTSSSNPAQTTGTYPFTFNNPGTYTYDCAVHGAAMTGTIVVR